MNNDDDYDGDSGSGSSREIKINPEYQSLVFGLSDEEYKTLKNSIIAADGLYVPIIVNQNGVILDGHHRYKACKELNKLPISSDKIEVRYFDDPLSEELFVSDININRRHLHGYKKIVSVLKQKSTLRKIAERNSKANLKQGDKVSEFPTDRNLSLGGRIDGQLGEKAEVSRDTIQKVEFIEEKATPEQKQKLEEDKISIDKVFQDLKDQEGLKQIQQKKEAGEILSDEEIMKTLNISIRPYDVWNFSGLDNRFGIKYPGQIPADIVFNVLYFFTKPNDLIVDFMAGGGVVGDVCNAFNGRRCLMYDINPPASRYP